jgi:hypothetical protein
MSLALAGGKDEPPEPLQEVSSHAVLLRHRLILLLWAFLSLAGPTHVGSSSNDVGPRDDVPSRRRGSKPDDPRGG